jgi:hypothetical protein
VSLTPVANNGNNIRLQTPESELEGKNLYICFLYRYLFEMILMLLSGAWGKVIHEKNLKQKIS